MLRALMIVPSAALAGTAFVVALALPAAGPSRDVAIRCVPTGAPVAGTIGYAYDAHDNHTCLKSKR